MWAGVIAIADQGRGHRRRTTLTAPPKHCQHIYSFPGRRFPRHFDGSNGYAAGPGYDLVTGRVTPVANLLVPALAGYEHRQDRCLNQDRAALECRSPATHSTSPSRPKSQPG